MDAISVNHSSDPSVRAVNSSISFLLLDSLLLSDTNIRRGSNSAGYDPFALEAVWRSFYFIGGIFVAMVLLYRYLIEGEGSGHYKIQARKGRRNNKLTYGMIFHIYGRKLVGTGGCWCLWDVCFYGLKLVR